MDDVRPQSAESTSRVLVMYVGGTIGMKMTPNGYRPAPGYLQEVVASTTRFHDPAGFPPEDSWTSVASPMAKARRLSSVVKRSTVEVWDAIDVKVVDKEGRMETGYSTLLAAAPSHAVQNASGLPSADAENSNTKALTRTLSVEQSIPTLITPPSLYGKRIRYSIMEYSPLLDSSNMSMADWVKIATTIELNYELYDAFIVLHGTDTMAYTASALSFMLENLGKTVILTGSQVPLAEIRNDAVENLLGALTIAGHFVIPEVCLYFNNKLFRGNRVTKLDATDFNAFDSPNMRPLVTVGVNIDVMWAEIFRPTAISKFRAQVKLNPNVGALRLFPGITESTVRASMAPPIQGVVLESYGAGNAPDCREDLMRALKDASDRGVVIVNCTQCKRGMVTDAYATGKALHDVGVVPGSDMTPECALVKLSFVLGCNNTPGECRALLRQNLRGELTVPSPKLRFAYNGDYLSLLQAIVAAAMGHASPESREMAVVLAQNVASNIPNHERLLIEKDLYAFLLCAAAKADDVEGLKMLENTAGHHLQMNCVDYDGRTPLHVASSEGHERCVEFLLRSGASVHVRDRWGHTALFDATRFRHPDVVRLLRETGAHFNGDEIDEVAERVCTAAAVGDVSMLKVCIAAGADVNRTGWDQRTALHAAAQEGRAESIAYLLSLPETDPSPSDRWGRTPLDVARHAVTLGSTLAEEVVRMLVEATAAAQRRRDSERTAGEPRSLAGIVGDCWIE